MEPTELKGIPVIVVRPSQITLFALIAYAFAAKHPESLLESLREAGLNIDSAFLERFKSETTQFVLNMAKVRQANELAAAQAELATIPKDQIN